MMAAGHVCTDSNFYSGTGLTKQELQFKRWCPYCDEVVTWQHRTPYTDEQYCIKCGFEILISDPRGRYPKGLDPQTGELEVGEP